MAAEKTRQAASMDEEYCEIAEAIDALAEQSRTEGDRIAAGNSPWKVDELLGPDGEVQSGTWATTLNAARDACTDQGLTTQ
jgi:hypothetical protein